MALWHPKTHCHLGDLVTIVQYLHQLPGEHVIYGNRMCRCGCGRRQEETLPQIISLLDTSVVFGGVNIPPEAQGIDPVWSNDGGTRENITYVKAKYLPVRHEQLVGVQFTPVMIDSERLMSSDNARRLFEVLKSQGVQRHQLANMSDATIFQAPSPYWGINSWGGNVLEKFEVLSKARLHISADSGTAHLAAMSDTPVVMISPAHLWNRYRTQSNVICCTRIDDAVVAIRSILNDLWVRKIIPPVKSALRPGGVRYSAGPDDRNTGH